jgi:hypothetical protein
MDGFTVARIDISDWYTTGLEEGETNWKPVGVVLTSDKKGVDVVNAAGVALSDAPFDISGAYNAGFDAIGSPTFEYTGIAAGTKQASPVVAAKIANKTGGGERKQTFTMSLTENTTDHTAELKYGSSVIGRIDVTVAEVPVASGDYAAGWNAARNKIRRNGDTIYRPKAMTAGGSLDAGEEEAYVGSAWASLDVGSAWGKAKLYRREKTSAGTGNWYEAEAYDTQASVTSGSVTYYFKAAGGYSGWNTTPSISGKGINWTDK